MRERLEKVEEKEKTDKCSGYEEPSRKVRGTEDLSSASAFSFAINASYDPGKNSIIKYLPRARRVEELPYSITWIVEKFSPDAETMVEFLLRFNSFASTRKFTKRNHSTWASLSNETIAVLSWTYPYRHQHLRSSGSRYHKDIPMYCAEGNRNIFRSTPPKAGENLQAYDADQKHFLERWVDVCMIEKISI